jgi:hypothetical protein
MIEKGETSRALFKVLFSNKHFISIYKEKTYLGKDSILYTDKKERDV